jgi:GNAT superfamily N-acetyltransferase
MRVELYRGDRAALTPLFRLAEDSESELAAYIGRGEVLVACEGGAIIGHAQVVEADQEGVRELKSMAVRQGHQRRGVGHVLVAAVIEYCRARNIRRLTVATAAADVGNLRFYQRQGFRFASIERDAFGPWTGYREGALIDGIPLRDRVVLDLEL